MSLVNDATIAGIPCTLYPALSDVDTTCAPFDSDASSASSNIDAPSNLSDADAPCIIFIDLPEHPFDVRQVATGLHCSVLSCQIPHWDDSLTPWTAPGLYREDPDFKGQAGATLKKLVDEIIPLAQTHFCIHPSCYAIAGYSLGGLFSLYAFTQCNRFAAVASMSGSVWYDRWIDYLNNASFDVTYNGKPRFAFLSIGTKEKRAAIERLHTVEDCTHRSAEIFTARGIDTHYAVGPGSHMLYVDERMKAAFTALDNYLR